MPPGSAAANPQAGLIVIYLDEAATTPIKREVLAAMGPYLGLEFANPSSHHEPGHHAREALEAARATVASHVGARPDEIIFTSGGTESNNLAIKGIALANPRGRHIVVSAVEHPSVLESAAWLETLGFEVTRLGVDREGLAGPDDLEEVLRSDTTLVSIQAANNEVGTRNFVGDLSVPTRERGIPFHTDAVQAAGTIDLSDLAEVVQAASISGHKIGAPKGIGALYVSRRTPLVPLVHGGGQERGMRSGTENVAAAVGLAKALELAAAVDPLAVFELERRRDAFIGRVLAEVQGAQLTGPGLDLRFGRLPGHASFVFPGRSGESILLDLERRGIVCSSGSACAAGSDEPSHVLTAMGYDREVAQTAVRFTFGTGVTTEQLDATVEALVDALEV